MLESPALTVGRGNQFTSFRVEPFGSSRHRTLGITALLPLGGSAIGLHRCLPALLRAVEQVIVVDCRRAAEPSDPGAVEEARTIAQDLGLAHRLHVLDYPYEVSPPGTAHLDTPPDSVLSLVHFHNWAFSHVRTTYALRWDASLVLTPPGEGLLSDFNWQVGHHQVTLRMPRHPLYVESDRVAYLDLAWANVDQCGHPVAPGYSYVKGFDREVLRLPHSVRHHPLPLGSCLLLRDIGEPTEPPSPASRTSPSSAEARRERYEADTLRSILAGRWRERPALHRLESPSGVHVVDHAATYWTAS